MRGGQTVSIHNDQRTWQRLPVQDWQDTRDTVHLWTQIVGKVRLALTPLANHWWNVPLYVNSVGLTTSLMPSKGDGVEIIFDFTTHALIIQTTTGEQRSMALEPRSVADFYAQFFSLLGDLGIEVSIYPVPVELVDVISFPEDNAHASYDADAMYAFWSSLVNAHRVFSRFRSEFRGKASPVHFFWGAFDLAVTRFSGRPAAPHPGGIPNCPDWVMREAWFPVAGTGPGGR
jgi:hypothetical protein